MFIRLKRAYKIYWLLWILTAMLIIPSSVKAQLKMIKILVSSPAIENKVYRSIGDVMVGSIIRELNRAGGMEIIKREKSESYLKEKGMNEWVGSRELALEVGEALGADIVIYSTLKRNYDFINYTIVFLEIKRDIIQRIINSSFPVSTSASEIGRTMKKDMENLIKYIPLPSELADPGNAIRQKTIDPEKLPETYEIEDIPPFDRFGYIEQILTYYRVFPGEEEYMKLTKQDLMTRFIGRQETDKDITKIVNKFYIYGDFAIRHNMQAYLIKDCSTMAINVLIANRIPVFCYTGVLVSYAGLGRSGNCIFKNIDDNVIESFDLTHRMRMTVMFIVPKPGRKGGISREYLENAVGYFKDEWGKTPKLVEITEGVFDLIPSEFE